MPEALPPAGPARVPTAFSAPISLETNNDNASPAEFQKRQSLTAAPITGPPNSPRVSTPKRSSSQHRVASSPSTTAPPGSLLRRSSSSLSINRRASTPTLTKRSSMTSLQGVAGVTSPRSPQRRSSTHFTSSPSPLVGRIDEGSEQVPPPTAASVASAYFQKELDIHSWTEEAAAPKRSKAIIIFHDSCYGHRYSRPRTSKASLNSIVERPERLLASALGVAAAYVRLGGRHADGKFPPHPKRTSQSMADYPFRIHKTTRSVSLTSPAVTNVHGLKWMEELKVMCDHAETKLAMNGKELVRPESKATGTDKEKPKFHEGDLYLCSDTLEALEGAIGAVCDGVDRVFGTLGFSKAFVCIRPPGHHCSSSYPSGFCWINNVNIGISHASIAHGLTHAAIIDFDLHHGDGSQAITWAHNARTAGLPKSAANSKRPSIGYFSLHDINSYPCEMGDEEKIRNASLCLENAHGQTIWNVHLQPWKDETEFWKLYESRYTVLIDKARDFLRAQTRRINTSTTQLQPKAAIFLSSGFDASQWESPGMQRHKVNVPTEFYARFTRDVVKLSEDIETGVNGRVISILEGGYSDRALCSGVLSHLSGLVGGDPVPEFQDIGLRAEMSKRLGTIDAYEGNDGSLEPAAEMPYNPDWWALPQLMELESLVNPPPPPPAPKKPRNPTPPTYTTPTQSFTAKIISSPKVRRSVSGTAGSASPRVVLSRPPSPIYPDVDWATATHELSKLLIPTERQTKSWRPEDLSAEAQRIKRERHSVVGLPDVQAGDGTRRSLRERKIRAPTPAVEEEEDDVPIKRENRRNTFAGAELIPEKVSARGTTSVGSGPIPIRQSGRRISVSSNAGPAGGDALRQASSDLSKSQLAHGPSSRISSQSGSATSIRASSSMSIRGEGNGGLVKKSRVSSQTKMEPPKARGTRKQPLASHRTLSSSSEAATSRRPTTSGNSAASDSSGPVRPNSEDDRELDNLTSAVKKITLHVPSREEHDMREKKRVEEKRGTQKPLKKTAAPKTSKTTKAEAKELISDTISVAFNCANSTTGIPQNPAVEAGVKARQSPPLQSTLVQTAAPSNGNPNSANIKFIPYTEDARQVHSHTPKAPVVWMPVNQNTPPPIRKGDLPVFTATSPITFAKAGAQASLGSKLRARDTAQGPEEGSVVRESGGDSCMAGVKDGGIVGNGEAMKEEEDYDGREGTNGANGSGTDVDIWEVPITPKH